jgi:uncharacterized membrane protein (DUF485 family)
MGLRPPFANYRVRSAFFRRIRDSKAAPTRRGTAETAKEERMSEHTAKRMDQEQFHALVKAKWTISLILTALILVIYFGFILVLAFQKEILMTKLGEGMTVGIPVGLGVILSACVLTGIYVYWANNKYDAAVKSVIQSMKE